MDKLIISGNQPLSGSVNISGAKNAALPILAATLLTDFPVILSNIPHLKDVTTMITLLSQMGVTLTMDQSMRLEVDTSGIHTCVAPYELVRTMRASIVVMGPLLARYGKAEVAMPGGCAIGTRPVDLHIAAFKKLGAEIDMHNGVLTASCKGRLRGCDITFEKVTVGGTENVVMAAVLAEGETRIHNAACEPEVTDLANFLNKIGAKIKGVGTSELIIEGVDALKGGEYHILPDRIEAGTYLVAGAMTRGAVQINRAAPETLTAILDKLRETGAEINVGSDWVRLDMKGEQPRAVDFSTAPYPLFPTDMQAQFMALNAVANGESKMTETIFENRFMHVLEMNRLGANIHLSGNTAICHGKHNLVGAPVMATDLRASAGLVLAGLMAQGETRVDRIYHIDRGYERIEEKLGALGAKIRRES